jgi:hypothetical protein
MRRFGDCGQLPLMFEAHRGQTSSAVKLLARGGDDTLFLAETAAVLRPRAPETGAADTTTTPARRRFHSQLVS